MSTTKPASWATNPIASVACFRRVILTANPHVPCQKQREPAKNGVSRRTVTRLPFPVSLKASEIKCDRTVFGNEADAVRFSLIVAGFAGGCAIIKSLSSRRHCSRIGEKLLARSKAVETCLLRCEVRREKHGGIPRR
jgi:hypothetical protein